MEVLKRSKMRRRFNKSSRGEIENNKKFNNGDLVFAKLRGHSVWPAKVINADARKYSVYFYGTGEKAKVNVKNLFPYEQYKVQFVLGKKLKRRSFRKAIEEIEAAEKGDDPAPENLHAVSEKSASESAMDVAANNTIEFSETQQELLMAEEESAAAADGRERVVDEDAEGASPQIEKLMQAKVMKSKPCKPETPLDTVILEKKGLLNQEIGMEENVQEVLRKETELPNGLHKADQASINPSEDDLVMSHPHSPVGSDLNAVIPESGTHKLELISEDEHGYLKITEQLRNILETNTYYSEHSADVIGRLGQLKFTKLMFLRNLEGVELLCTLLRHGNGRDTNWINWEDKYEGELVTYVRSTTRQVLQMITKCIGYVQNNKSHLDNLRDLVLEYREITKNMKYIDQINLSDEEYKALVDKKARERESKRFYLAHT